MKIEFDNPQEAIEMMAIVHELALKSAEHRGRVLNEEVFAQAKEFLEKAVLSYQE